MGEKELLYMWKRVSQSTFQAFQGENDYHARIHLGTFQLKLPSDHYQDDIWAVAVKQNYSIFLELASHLVVYNTVLNPEPWVYKQNS